jgi:hypothetical protein
MPKLSITPEDLKRSLVCDANWYPVHIDSVTEELNKKGDANNIIVDMTVVQSGDEDKDKFVGVSLRRYFSEKAPGMATNFIIACGGAIDPESGGEFELESAAGKQVEAYVKPRQYEGRMVNDVVDFQAPGGQEG